MIFCFAGHQQVGIGVDEDLVVTVVVGEDGLDEFTQGVNGAGPPGGLPLFCEVDAVTLPFGEGGEVGEVADVVAAGGLRRLSSEGRRVGRTEGGAGWTDGAR